MVNVQFQFFFFLILVGVGGDDVKSHNFKIRAGLSGHLIQHFYFTIMDWSIQKCLITNP